MDAPSLRAWIYDELARVFDGDVTRLSPPSSGGDLGPSSLADAVAALCAATGTDLLDARADHARLFLNAPGGAGVPPYASWYLDGQLFGPATRWVEQAYTAQGLEPEVGTGEPPDYLGAELEFMYFLTRHEIAARGTHDGEALRGVLASEATFVGDHLARWLPPFLAAVRASHPGPVFSAAADLLDLTVGADRERLRTV